MHVLKFEKHEMESDYVHLLNAICCWNFTCEDHPYLLRLDLFKTLQSGDGTLMHPIFRCWGMEKSLFSLHFDRDEESFGLECRLR